ncbi:MAG: dihydroorotate dehydrogenase electron transfer subunit [Lachnospiraceae bacterium]|nr:dihydroorotate dehydrogenase electron transfer subunit [Lachnospiraceae bacterium]
MKRGLFTITENKQLVPGIMRMRLTGDTSAFTAPGQFLNIKLDGLYLRRPISLCDLDGDTMTIIYKVVGHGTEAMAKMQPGTELDILTGLGNGYDLSEGKKPILLGGGVGVPPMYYLAKKLIEKGCAVTAVLGFNKKDEIFYEDEFKALGAKTIVTTADGSHGTKGFVTDAMADVDYDHFYACGPEPMLRAVFKASQTSGQMSFEKRMGCGFGACMGCSCKTITGYKRICKEGPVMRKEEILWED